MQFFKKTRYPSSEEYRILYFDLKIIQIKKLFLKKNQKRAKKLNSKTKNVKNWFCYRRKLERKTTKNDQEVQITTENTQSTNDFNPSSISISNQRVYFYNFRIDFCFLAK